MHRNRLLALTRMTVGLVFLAAGAAQAHIEVQPQAAEAGEFVLLHFLVYHGCDSAATTQVTVKIPDGVQLVRPQVKPGWQISTVTGKYAEPIFAGEKPITEGFVEVTWSGNTVPPLYTDDFALLARMPFKAGEKATFLAQQHCEGLAQTLDFAPVVSLHAPPAAAKPEAASSLSEPRVALILGGLGLLTGLVAIFMARRRA